MIISNCTLNLWNYPNHNKVILKLTIITENVRFYSTLKNTDKLTKPKLLFLIKVTPKLYTNVP